MINNNGIKLTTNLTELIREGIKSYATKIDINRNKIESALSGNEEKLALGDIEELVLINEALQEHINEAEKLLNKPIPRGM